MAGHQGGLSLYPRQRRVDGSPFSAAPDPRYLYMSDKHREALAHLLYGVSAAGGFVLLTGEVGTGKTTLCRCLVDQLPDNVDLALCFNPRLSETELLEHICDELRVSYASGLSLKCLVSCLNRHLLVAHARGRTTVLLIDEAQNLSKDVLEQLRLLTNLETERTKLLQIILVGQPELDELLASSELRQLAQRITARYHLTELGARETSNLIRHRLLVGGLSRTLFTGPALREVYRWSQGIPRLINSICDRALLAAYVRDVARIDRRLARTAAVEVQISSPRRKKSVAWISTPLGVVAGFAVAVILLSGPAMVGWPSTSFADLLSLTRRAALTLATEQDGPTAATLTSDRADFGPDDKSKPPAVDQPAGARSRPSTLTAASLPVPDATPVGPLDALQQLILEGWAAIDLELRAACTESANLGSLACDRLRHEGPEPLVRMPYAPSLPEVFARYNTKAATDLPAILGVWRVSPTGPVAVSTPESPKTGPTDHVVNP